MEIDSNRYVESFIQAVKDFKELSEVQFFIEYCISSTEKYNLEQDYNSYSNNENELTYNEWLEEVYYEENEKEIYERVLEYRQPNLDYIVYKTDDNNFQIYEITLAFWWPNINLTLYSRWNRAIYEFDWEDNLEINLSYMYNDIYDYLNLDVYE